MLRGWAKALQGKVLANEVSHCKMTQDLMFFALGESQSELPTQKE